MIIVNILHLWHFLKKAIFLDFHVKFTSWRLCHSKNWMLNSSFKNCFCPSTLGKCSSRYSQIAHFNVSKIAVFKGKGPEWMTSVSRRKLFGFLQKVLSDDGAFHPRRVCRVSTKSLGRVLVERKNSRSNGHFSCSRPNLAMSLNFGIFVDT